MSSANPAPKVELGAPKLELHLGEDYAVAMLPEETTGNAAVMFGPDVDDAWCAELVRRYNDYELLLIAAKVILHRISSPDPKPTFGEVNALAFECAKATWGA